MVTKNLLVATQLWRLKMICSPHAGGDRKFFGYHPDVATKRFLIAIITWQLNSVTI
jgi:hypothetical protein